MYNGWIKVFYNGSVPGHTMIILENPPVNALSIELVEDLYNALSDIDKDKNTKFLSIAPNLAGTQDKHFSAGADLKERASMSDKKTIEFLDKLNKCFDLLENLKVPTFACIMGATLGGGAELALCCDLILGVDNDNQGKKISAKIGFPETSLGIIPGAGGTYRIFKKMNSGLAKYWIFSGKVFSLQEAYDDGFVDFIFKSYSKLSDFMVKTTENTSRTSLVAAKASMNKCYLENDRKKQRLIELEEYKKTLDSSKRKEALKKYKKK